VVEEGVWRVMDKVDKGDIWLTVTAGLVLLVAALSGGLGNFAGVVAGGLISGMVARFYYRRAGEELKREAGALRRETARLRRHTTLILRGLEEAGLVEYNRDEQGEIVSMVIKGSVEFNPRARSEDDAHQE
jgi:hypothetical protein